MSASAENTKLAVDNKSKKEKCLKILDKVSVNIAYEKECIQSLIDQAKLSETSARCWPPETFQITNPQNIKTLENKEGSVRTLRALIEHGQAIPKEEFKKRMGDIMVHAPTTEEFMLLDNYIKEIGGNPLVNIPSHNTAASAQTISSSAHIQPPVFANAVALSTASTASTVATAVTTATAAATATTASATVASPATAVAAPATAVIFSSPATAVSSAGSIQAAQTVVASSADSESEWITLTLT
jgi:hypothetical protein